MDRITDLRGAGRVGCLLDPDKIVKRLLQLVQTGLRPGHYQIGAQRDFDAISVEMCV